VGTLYAIAKKFINGKGGKAEKDVMVLVMISSLGCFPPHHLFHFLGALFQITKVSVQAHPRKLKYISVTLQHTS
jgi:hypothetical protein